MKTQVMLIILCAYHMCIFGQDRIEFKFDNGTIGYQVKGDDGWGVEDRQGKIIVPKIYGKLNCYGNLIYCEEKKNSGNNKCELYNTLGERKISEEDGCRNLNFVKSNGKWIAINGWNIYDENGNMIYKYKELKDALGFNYLINELTDTIVIEPGKYMGNFKIKNGIILTSNGTKVGICNLDGTTVIPANMFQSIITCDNEQGNEIRGFYVSYSLSGPRHYQYYGFYDRKGICIFPADKYTDLCYYFDNGMYTAKENDKAIVIDSIGNVKFKTKYNSLKLKEDEHGKMFYETYLGNGKGKISENGDLIEEVKSTTYEKQSSKCIWIIDSEGLVGAKSLSGKILIPCEYDGLIHTDQYFINGFFLYKNGRAGFADSNGKIIIPCEKYNEISLLKGGNKYFVVEYMGRKGLCDENGNELIKPIYDDIKYEWDEKIHAHVGNMEGIIDEGGNIIVPFEYTKVVYDQNTGNYEVEILHKKGVCNGKGQIIIPACYTKIQSSYYLKNGPLGLTYTVKDGKTEGIYTNDGKMIFPTGLFEHLYIDNFHFWGLPVKDEWYIKAWSGNDIEKADLFYYDFNGNLLYDSREDKLVDEYIEQGRVESRNNNYKKAIYYFNKAIEIKQDDRAYYNLGVAYYKMRKYKDAISNLNSCSRISKSQLMKEQASNLIFECEQCLQQKRERRANLWLEMLGTALSAASVVIQTNNALNNYNSNSAASTTNEFGLKRNTSLDYLLDPRYAMMQVQRENWNEYLQTTNGGQTMTYEEWYALKAQAWAESKKVESDSSKSSSASSHTNGQSTDSSSGSSGRQCRVCLGNGKCRTCNGKGWYFDNTFGIGREYICPNCHNHNGRCASCGGSGRR